MTVLENTERPVTITYGTNQLVGRDFKRLRTATSEVLRGHQAAEKLVILLWDGRAAHRIAHIITSDAGH